MAEKSVTRAIVPDRTDPAGDAPRARIRAAPWGRACLPPTVRCAPAPAGGRPVGPAAPRPGRHHAVRSAAAPHRHGPAVPRRATDGRRPGVACLRPTRGRPAEGDGDPGRPWPGRGSSPRPPRARVRAASRADGAAETGLTQLLWVNALHMAGDALIAVSLAGTLFFAATTDAQRGNVALYLLVTMAPFAVLAPVHRPGAGPAAARSPLGDGGQLARPRPARAGDDEPLRRLLALPGGARRPRAVEGAQRAARRGRPPRAAPRHVADLGERPPVGVRPGHGRAWPGRSAPGSRRCSASTAELWRDRRRLPRRRGARGPAAPARRRARPANCRRTC